MRLRPNHLRENRFSIRQARESLLCILGSLCVFFATRVWGIDQNLDEQIRQRSAALESKLIGWRRDIHEHPELGDQELRTAKLVADHLRSLGLEVTTGVARTGVVALLRGGKPGPVVALRADMDALPVKEAVDLPFASKVKGTYAGAPSDSIDLMHACGHDAHTAILMVVAEVLTGLKDQLPGTVKFIFQPAEGGPSDFIPNGKNVWGAKLMIQESVLTNPKPDAIFGLHVTSVLPAATIGYRPGAAMASSDELHIKVVAARRTIVLADSAKFNHKLLGHITSLEQIDILVTDAEPPRELFGTLEELEVQVLVAPPLNSNHRPQAYDRIYLANVFARLDALTTTWGRDG